MLVLHSNYGWAQEADPDGPRGAKWAVLVGLLDSG